MNTDRIFNSLRPFIARFVAGIVGSFAAYLETKYGVILDPDTKANLVIGALAVYGTVYPIVHRLIDKKVNPGDAASTHMAIAEKAQVEAIKTSEKNNNSLITPSN